MAMGQNFYAFWCRSSAEHKDLGLPWNHVCQLLLQIETGSGFKRCSRNNRYAHWTWYSVHIISYHVISYHIISCHIISFFISYHFSYHIISYHIISFFISYHIISYHIISFFISYHIIFRIISYHFSYHIIFHIISHLILFHIISHLISYLISYDIMSCHIISYHIMSCHVMSCHIIFHAYFRIDIDFGIVDHESMFRIELVEVGLLDVQLLKVSKLRKPLNRLPSTGKLSASGPLTPALSILAISEDQSELRRCNHGTTM